MRNRTNCSELDEKKCFNTCSRSTPEKRNECSGVVVASDYWRDSIGEPIECEYGSCIRDIEFFNRISVMQLHVGRKKGMIVNFLPRMVAVFVFVCLLLLQNGRPTFAAFTTGKVKLIFFFF